jgi:serine/threonine protein kinase
MGNRASALREVHAMAALAAAGNCPSLMHYQSVWQEDAQIYIQLEWCDGGSLTSQLNDEKRRFDDTRLLDVALQMAKVTVIC